MCPGPQRLRLLLRETLSLPRALLKGTGWAGLMSHGLSRLLPVAWSAPPQRSRCPLPPALQASLRCQLCSEVFPHPLPILPATPHLFFVSTFKQKCRCYLRMLFVISAPPSVNSTFCLFCLLLHIQHSQRCLAHNSHLVNTEQRDASYRRP